MIMTCLLNRRWEKNKVKIYNVFVILYWYIECSIKVCINLKISKRPCLYLQSSKLIDIQTQLEEKIEECKQLAESTENVKKTCSEQEQRIGKLLQKTKDVCDSQIQSEEQFRQEIEAKSNLIELYKVNNVVYK